MIANCQPELAPDSTAISGSERRLVLRLTNPGKDFYWHCRKRKKMPAIELPKGEFEKALWPGKGLTAATACDCCYVAREITTPGVYDVECGSYQITAHNL